MKGLEISLLLQSVSTMFLLILPGFFLDEQENKKSGINLLTRETDANTVLKSYRGERHTCCSQGCESHLMGREKSKEAIGKSWDRGIWVPLGQRPRAPAHSTADKTGKAS